MNLCTPNLSEFPFFFSQPPLTATTTASHRNLNGLTQITGVLDETSKQANDAETIAHDALASIDARAHEITASMGRARSLQDDYAELKFSMDAAK